MKCFWNYYSQQHRTWNVQSSSQWSPGPWECGWQPPGWSSCWRCTWWSLSHSCGWQERGWGWPRSRFSPAVAPQTTCALGESCKCWHRSPETSVNVSLYKTFCVCIIMLKHLLTWWMRRSMNVSKLLIFWFFSVLRFAEKWNDDGHLTRRA